jgi:hypothetical protein
MPKYSSIIVTKQDGTEIPRNEPVFVLRAQDILAPIDIMFYAKLVETATNNRPMVEDIKAVARAMEAWWPRKLPDEKGV